MIIENAPDGMTCHLKRKDGKVVHVGDLVARLKPGESAEWFTTKGVREQRTDVDIWRRGLLAIELQVEANARDKLLEYSNKRVEAERWLDLHPTEDNAVPPVGSLAFEHIRAEVDFCNCTFFEAATAIMVQVALSATQARERIQIREQGRAIQADVEAANNE